MKIIETIDKMQTEAEKIRLSGRRIGLVPTMGFLHEGHLSLIRNARESSDTVITSIFVNPTQFGPGEDYEDYPRDPERDIRMAEAAGSDIIFHPSAKEMYPEGYQTFVTVEKLTKVLCGLSRPQHFRGVTTVVIKLFNATKPHLAIFGQKDAQQALVIRRMVNDLNLDIEIKISPIIREPDGLAMSSRNTYLDATQRKNATVLYRSLILARQLIESGERSARRISDELVKIIAQTDGAEIDYVSMVDTAKLEPVQTLSGEILIAEAVRFGKTRLIDNIILTV
ncbi:pantoate--beta-alanine ligase [candidate division KSB1 bacterium]|nr:pantoate--beta-alanine ligase [candidate division KSB1 bacterium]